MTARTIVAALLTLLTVGVAGEGLAERLRSVAATYYARAGSVATITSRDSTMDYYQRLLDDAGALNDPAIQHSAVRLQIAQTQAQLDMSLAQQLLNRAFIPMSSIRGAGETFVRSSKDGTMQPVAVYVPHSYSSEKPAPLVVFLHGKSQPESNLVAPLFVQEIAEQTGSIVVAPYGHSYWEFEGAETEVYDAATAAEQAFSIARDHRYLAGYSMGGFAVFRIAPIHPSAWAAILTVSGALLSADAQRFLTTNHNIRIYIVTGAHDGVVNTSQSTGTATFLAYSGFQVSFYSQPDGTHNLSSLQPALTNAWNDMLHGYIHPPSQ